MICSSQTVRLVNHCFTTRTSRTGRGLVYTPQVPVMICNSQLYDSQAIVSRPVRAVQVVDLYIHSKSPNDMQFTNCTTRKPLFHDPYEPYESYGSWTCIYTLSLSNDIRFTNYTTCKPLFHDPYESYESYESWTCR